MLLEWHALTRTRRYRILMKNTRKFLAFLLRSSSREITNSDNAKEFVIVPRSKNNNSKVSNEQNFAVFKDELSARHCKC